MSEPGLIFVIRNNSFVQHRGSEVRACDATAAPLVWEIFKFGKALLLSFLMGAVKHLPKVFPL